MNEEILAKVEALAKLDKEINGFYANAPYAVYHESKWYTAYLRHRSNEERTKYLEVKERPHHVGNVDLT